MKYEIGAKVKYTCFKGMTAFEKVGVIVRGSFNSYLNEFLYVIKGKGNKNADKGVNESRISSL